MKYYAVATDTVRNEPFGIVVKDGRHSVCHGLHAAGHAWADLYNTGETKTPFEGLPADIELSPYGPLGFDVDDALDQESVTIPTPQSATLVDSVWEPNHSIGTSLKNVSLTQVPGQSRQLALDYKAHAFLNDSTRSSLLLAVRLSNGSMTPEYTGFQSKGMSRHEYSHLALGDVSMRRAAKDVMQTKMRILLNRPRTYSLLDEIPEDDVQTKGLGRTIGQGGRRARRIARGAARSAAGFDPNARDADLDMLIQEGTAWERPALPGKPDLPETPGLGKRRTPQDRDRAAGAARARVEADDADIVRGHASERLQPGANLFGQDDRPAQLVTDQNIWTNKQPNPEWDIRDPDYPDDWHESEKHSGADAVGKIHTDNIDMEIIRADEIMSGDEGWTVVGEYRDIESAFGNRAEWLYDNPVFDTPEDAAIWIDDLDNAINNDISYEEWEPPQYKPPDDPPRLVRQVRADGTFEDVPPDPRFDFDPDAEGYASARRTRDTHNTNPSIKKSKEVSGAEFIRVETAGSQASLGKAFWEPFVDTGWRFEETSAGFHMYPPDNIRNYIRESHLIQSHSDEKGGFILPDALAEDFAKRLNVRVGQLDFRNNDHWEVMKEAVSGESYSRLEKISVTANHNIEGSIWKHLRLMLSRDGGPDAPSKGAMRKDMKAMVRNGGWGDFGPVKSLRGDKPDVDTTDIDKAIEAATEDIKLAQSEMSKLGPRPSFEKRGVANVSANDKVTLVTDPTKLAVLQMALDNLDKARGKTGLRADPEAQERIRVAIGEILDGIDGDEIAIPRADGGFTVLRDPKGKSWKETRDLWADEMADARGRGDGLAAQKAQRIADAERGTDWENQGHASRREREPNQDFNAFWNQLRTETENEIGLTLDELDTELGKPDPDPEKIRRLGHQALDSIEESRMRGLASARRPSGDRSRRRGESIHTLRGEEGTELFDTDREDLPEDEFSTGYESRGRMDAAIKKTVIAKDRAWRLSRAERQAAREENDINLNKQIFDDRMSGMSMEAMEAEYGMDRAEIRSRDAEHVATLAGEERYDAQPNLNKEIFEDRMDGMSLEEAVEKYGIERPEIRAREATHSRALVGQESYQHQPRLNQRIFENRMRFQTSMEETSKRFHMDPAEIRAREIAHLDALKQRKLGGDDSLDIPPIFPEGRDGWTSEREQIVSSTGNNGPKLAPPGRDWSVDHDLIPDRFHETGHWVESADGNLFKPYDKVTKKELAQLKRRRLWLKRSKGTNADIDRELEEIDQRIADISSQKKMRHPGRPTPENPGGTREYWNQPVTPKQPSRIRPNRDMTLGEESLLRESGFPEAMGLASERSEGTGAQLGDAPAVDEARVSALNRQIDNLRTSRMQKKINELEAAKAAGDNKAVYRATKQLREIQEEEAELREQLGEAMGVGRVGHGYKSSRVTDDWDRDWDRARGSAEATFDNIADEMAAELAKSKPDQKRIDELKTRHLQTVEKAQRDGLASQRRSGPPWMTPERDRANKKFWDPSTFDRPRGVGIDRDEQGFPRRPEDPNRPDPLVGDGRSTSERVRAAVTERTAAPGFASRRGTAAAENLTASYEKGTPRLPGTSDGEIWEALGGADMSDERAARLAIAAERLEQRLLNTSHIPTAKELKTMGREADSHFGRDAPGYKKGETIFDGVKAGDLLQTFIDDLYAKEYPDDPVPSVQDFRLRVGGARDIKALETAIKETFSYLDTGSAKDKRRMEQIHKAFDSLSILARMREFGNYEAIEQLHPKHQRMLLDDMNATLEGIGSVPNPTSPAGVLSVADHSRIADMTGTLGKNARGNQTFTPNPDTNDGKSTAWKFASGYDTAEDFHAKKSRFRTRGSERPTLRSMVSDIMRPGAPSEWLERRRADAARLRAIRAGRPVQQRGGVARVEPWDRILEPAEMSELKIAARGAGRDARKPVIDRVGNISKKRSEHAVQRDTTRPVEGAGSQKSFAGPRMGQRGRGDGRSGSVDAPDVVDVMDPWQEAEGRPKIGRKFIKNMAFLTRMRRKGLTEEDEKRRLKMSRHPDSAKIDSKEELSREIMAHSQSLSGHSDLPELITADQLAELFVDTGEVDADGEPIFELLPGYMPIQRGMGRNNEGTVAGEGATYWQQFVRLRERFVSRVRFAGHGAGENHARPPVEVAGRERPIGNLYGGYGVGTGSFLTPESKVIDWGKLSDIRDETDAITEAIDADLSILPSGNVAAQSADASGGVIFDDPDNFTGAVRSALAAAETRAGGHLQVPKKSKDRTPHDPVNPPDMEATGSGKRSLNQRRGKTRAELKIEQHQRPTPEEARAIAMAASRGDEATARTTGRLAGSTLTPSAETRNMGNIDGGDPAKWQDTEFGSMIDQFLTMFDEARASGDMSPAELREFAEAWEYLMNLTSGLEMDMDQSGFQDFQLFDLLPILGYDAVVRHGGVVSVSNRGALLTLDHPVNGEQFTKIVETLGKKGKLSGGDADAVLKTEVDGEYGKWRQPQLPSRAERRKTKKTQRQAERARAA